MKLSEYYRRQIMELIRETKISIAQLARQAPVSYDQLHTFVNYGRASVHTHWLDKVLGALNAEKRKQDAKAIKRTGKRSWKKSRARPIYAGEPKGGED